jgi:hypothetical protein
MQHGLRVDRTWSAQGIGVAILGQSLRMPVHISRDADELDL